MANKNAKGKRKVMEYVVITARIEKPVYEKMLKLKIAEGDGGSINGYLNKKLAKVINDNEVLIKGYEVDHDNSDF